MPEDTFLDLSLYFIWKFVKSSKLYHQLQHNIFPLLVMTNLFNFFHLLPVLPLSVTLNIVGIGPIVSSISKFVKSSKLYISKKKSISPLFDDEKLVKHPSLHQFPLSA